jgi:hypothetical protein
MSAFLLAFGDWRLRHNEPCEGRRATLSLRAMPPGRHAPEHHSLLLDLRGELRERCRVSGAGISEAPPGTFVASANLAAHELPLAALQLHGEQLRVTHLLTRVEKHLTHLIRPPEALPPGRLDALSQLLRAGFEANHLALNNFECHYIKGLPDTELEQKFNIAGAYDYHLLNRQWFEALAEGRIEGFAPQFGDEIQHWSYDNDFARILPNAEQASGYLSVMHWSRVRKARWDDPVVTFKKKLYGEDALERWERNYPNQRVGGGAEAALRGFFQLPIAMLPSWRRTRYDMACEALATGNIFMVNFEDSRVRDDDSARARLQQCEIEYLKTRGQPHTDRIYEDLARLSQAVETFMRAQGLDCERTNYSKLSFLEHYARGPGAPASSAPAAQAAPCASAERAMP